MNNCSLLKKVIHGITISSESKDEREQLEGYKIATFSLSVLVILLVISSTIRETIQIRFDVIYPFSGTAEFFLYLGLIGLVGSYLLCKKGAVEASSALVTLILGISFPIYLGNILSDILLKGIFSDLHNFQKANIQNLIIFLIFVFVVVIYFALNKVYIKSITSYED